MDIGSQGIVILSYAIFLVCTHQNESRPGGLIQGRHLNSFTPQLGNHLLRIH